MRQQCLALGLLLAISARAFTQSSGAPRVGPTPGRACGKHCGTERWTLKTLTDGKSAAVLSATPQATSISDLILLAAPTKLPQSSRVPPTEMQQFTVEALLIAWKQEAGAKGDQDFHLVLADPSDHTKTMIAEIPSPGCASACASAKVGAFQAARDLLIQALGPVPTTTSVTLLNPPRRVTVTGVGFFDFNHKQDGLARNCIELHPVLQITVTGDEPGGTIPLPSGVPHKCGTPPGGGSKRSPPPGHP